MDKGFLNPIVYIAGEYQVTSPLAKITSNKYGLL